MNIDINKIEEDILEFWKNNEIFEKTLEQRKKSKPFVFFEGPPTANAQPGIHHFLGRAIKDLFVRYKTMRGYNVTRKAGWDTHGLPVEIEVEKNLGQKNKKDIEKYGVGKFNAKAKENVWKYKEEWEKLTARIGFWLDLDNPYITYDKDYIETLWHIIKRIDKRGLLYGGHKVLPWCPRCGTVLSSHEVAQGYENITENSVYVKFRIKSGQKIGNFVASEPTFILAWTTTPWTLPGNVALAVGAGIKYQAVSIRGNYEKYILAADLAEKILNAEYEILDTIFGKDLVNLEYEPFFEVEKLKLENSYKIYAADFVTTGEGTGIVHVAPMYGEDDYKLGEKIGLPKHHTVDDEGRFTKDVPEFAGRFVKDAEPDIINYLKNNGALFKAEPYAHDYPFCWRCKSPLLYYARNSWFVAMSKLRKELLKNNKKINWIPGHLKEGRFGEFLKEAKDWAFSRERFWGTPLPLWKCKCGNNLIAGSYEELHQNAFPKLNIFYYARHATSAKNDGNIISSRLESDRYHLTEKGIEESKNAAKKLKKYGGADMIISSPFLRAKETAEIIGDILGVKIQIDERLNEIDHGSACEGRDQFMCLGETTPSDLKFKFGDGESWMDVRKRMAAVLADLNKKYEGKKILIVSHGDPLAILEAITEMKSDKELLETLKAINPAFLEPKNGRKSYPKRGELKRLNYKYGPYDEFGYLNPHRPYVDGIFLKCRKCGDKMVRAKEVVDVWFDSGAMPYGQIHWPFSGEKLKLPADFIAEGIDQTRGWFYTLLAVSTLLKKGAPYKNVISYSHVLDEKGGKMSKSLGNTVDPWDIIDRFGADSARWYFYTVNNPGEPKLFSTKDVAAQLFGFLTTLFNSFRFFELYFGPDKVEFADHLEPKNILDKWIFSRIQNLIKFTTRKMDEYDLTNSSRAIEKFVVGDLSNWWIRRSRQRFQRPKNSAELSEAVSFLRYLLLQTSKLIAPFTPFIAEHLHIKLHKGKAPSTLSVHLHDWPGYNGKFIDKELEEKMENLRNLAAKGLAQRKEKNIKVRQALAAISLKVKIDPELEVYLKDEVNVRGISCDPNQKEDVLLDTRLSGDLIVEGYVREIIRKIQDMRKEAGYGFDRKVSARWRSEDEEIKKAVERFESEIKTAALLDVLEEYPQPKQSFDVETEFDLAPGRKIWIGIWGK